MLARQKPQNTEDPPQHTQTRSRTPYRMFRGNGRWHWLSSKGLHSDPYHPTNNHIPNERPLHEVRPTCRVEDWVKWNIPQVPLSHYSRQIDHEGYHWKSLLLDRPWLSFPVSGFFRERVFGVFALGEESAVVRMAFLSLKVWEVVGWEPRLWQWETHDDTKNVLPGNPGYWVSDRC